MKTEIENRAEVEEMLRPRDPWDDPDDYRMLALDEMVRALGVEEDPLLSTAETLLDEEMKKRRTHCQVGKIANHARHHRAARGAVFGRADPPALRLSRP